MWLMSFTYCSKMTKSENLQNVYLEQFKSYWKFIVPSAGIQIFCSCYKHNKNKYLRSSFDFYFPSGKLLSQMSSVPWYTNKGHFELHRGDAKLKARKLERPFMRDRI